MKRPFLPNFINAIDKKLLLHKPDTWSTRIHIVAWFSLIFMLVLAVLGLVGFPNAREDSWNETGVGVVALICFIGFIFWVIYLLRFNVFKKFGLQKPFAGIKMFLLLFSAVFCIVLPTYVFPIIESILANKQYTSDEIVKDVNFMNAAFIKLNYKYAPKEWQRDTIVGVPDNDSRIYVYDNDNYIDYYINKVVVYDSATDNEVTYGHKLVPEKHLQSNLSNADSSYRINDSTYALMRAPYLQLVSATDADIHSGIRLKNAKDLMVEEIERRAPFVDTLSIGKELAAVIAKYKVKEFYPYYDENYVVDNDVKNHEPYEQRVNRLYSASRAESGIRNISDKKYRWDLSNADAYIRIIFYITLVLSLLVFIFRHSTKRTFFLSLLTALVLFIMSVIIIASSGERADTTIPLLFLIYYLSALGISLTIFGAEVRTAWQGIALNLSVFFMPYVPLAMYALYDAQKRYNLPSTSKYKYESDPQMYFYAEIIGIFILLILIEPFIKKLFRKWFALPED